MRLAWLALCLGGCQCLVPVDELPDGGADAGALECAAPSDCGGEFTTVHWCQGDGGADWSCVDHRCVPQCQGHGGETCETEAPTECLKCPASSACLPPDCGGGLDVRWRVEQVQCPGQPLLLPGDVVHEWPDGGCEIPLLLERDGGSALLGHLYLQSARGLSARLDALGGTCLVSELPTGLERLLFACPRCQFVISN